MTVLQAAALEFLKCGGPGSGRHPGESLDLSHYVKSAKMAPADINNGYCGDFAVAVAKDNPDVRVHVGVTHTYLEHNQKFYDAESPSGVANAKDLKIFDGNEKDAKDNADRVLPGKEYYQKYRKSFNTFI